MARKIVDIGVSGNDGTGDSIREAFRKTNDNFQELYAVFGQGGFLKFTDLSDTPDTLVGEGGKVPVVNSVGTQLVFKNIESASGTISITQDDNTISIDTLSSRLYDDPLPRLKYGMNASNQVIGGLRSPTLTSDFVTAVNDFNTQHGTSYSIDSFAINKGYADSRFVNTAGDTMSGHLNVPAGASGNQVPRASETVLKTGGTMSGDLFLSDHPGALAGAGTPTAFDDLQAATKYYVDNSTYTSQINLFVSSNGDDQQSKTPAGKEGRAWSYAFRSVNKACQKAEEIMAAAPLETGPYRQLIAYGDGVGFSEVTQVTVGSNGTTRIYFSNNSGARVDQGALPQPDIIPGKIVIGRTSGAKGIIYQYYGVDGNSDYFDLQDVDGDFELGENLWFDHPVKKMQITVFVESGIYEEDYPIRIPQNTAIVGEELRRVLIRPADRVSRSPWASIWFRRDKVFDGLDITSTEFGYHYLTDPSDPLSEPKNNRDMDVFLCNDAVIIRQISCQGHGGFMMVLDPEGQILSKSAYVQQSGSFAQSLNKQSFRGGQFVDGFAGNLPFQVIGKFNDSNTELLITGAERPPSTPTSFVIDGRTYKIDTYTDDGNGYAGARELLRKNKDFIKAEVIGYINNELSPEFTYNRTTCARDVGLIVDSLGYDLALGSNFNAVRAGLAYYRGNQYDILPSQLTQTYQAMAFVKEKAATVVSGNSVAVDSVNAGIDRIVNIIGGASSPVPTFTYPNPTGYDTGYQDARRLVLANKEFIQEEMLSWIAKQITEGIEPFTTDYRYNTVACKRDVGYIIDALGYDLTYSCNLETLVAASAYYSGTSPMYGDGEKEGVLAAYTYLKDIIYDIARGIDISPTDGNTLFQDTTGTGGSSGAGTFVQARIQDIYDTIDSDGTLPAEIAPSLSWVNSGLLNARNLLDAATTDIQDDIVAFINLNYPDLVYNEATCKRDVGQIITALGYDLMFNSNFRSTKAAMAYYRASASVAVGEEKEAVLAAMEELKVAAKAIVAVNSTAVTRVNDNMDNIISIVTNGIDTYDTVVMPNPTGLDTGVANAKALILSNFEFLKAEAIAFVDQTYGLAFSYDKTKCARDAGYMLNAAIYDLIYGGNSATVEAGLQYYDGNGNLLIPGQTLQTTQAISYLKGLVEAIVVNTNIPYPKQTLYRQTKDLVNPGSSGAAATLGGYFDDINTIILGGRDAAPEITYPTFAGISSALTDVRGLLVTAKPSIQSDTTTYLDQTYAYNQNTCARDTGYIVDAIAHDIYYSGNLKTIQAGLAYFKASASAKIVVDSQLNNTISAISYIKTLMLNVINNESPDNRYQSTVIQYINTSITTGNLASSTIESLFEEMLAIISTPPAARDARDLLVANKEFIKAEVIKYINYNYVSFTYDKVKCARDVGYIVDALAYDVLFQSNFQSIIAGRSYYRGNAATVVGSQKAATLDAFTYLKTLVIAAVTGNATAVTSVTTNMDHILSIIDNGITFLPAFVTPTPTGGTGNAFDSGYANTRDLIDANRDFIEEEVIKYLTDNYPSLSYDTGSCRRDVQYILDALYYDLTYGGNLQTLIAANAYYVGAVLQVPPGEKNATLDAYTYMQSLVQQIAIDLDVSQLQNVVAQVRGTPGSIAAQNAASNLVNAVITTINLGTAPSPVAPNTAWVGSTLVTSYSNLLGLKSTMQTQVTDYVDSNYGSSFTYNEEICSRDVGFIIGNVSADLLYGGTYNTVRAARRYHIGTVSSRVVIDDQLSETLDALDYARQLAVNVINQTTPAFNYQELTGVDLEDRVLQVTDSDLDGSAFEDRINELMGLLNAIVADPEADITVALTDAKEIEYPIYRLILSDTTPITNELSYNIVSAGGPIESTVGDGSYDVEVTIPVQEYAPLTKTRYRISGNSNADYNLNAVECVASTTTTMTFRYPSNPGTFGTGTTTITYFTDLMTLSAGNTSMCCNDFTQINDLAYGLVATNIGLIEAVSVFTYYNWTAYYANNGGQIRSLNGSNAHGEYGIISEGSDPLEVPDTCNLSDDMMQVAQVYKTGIYATDNVVEDIAVFVYNHSYAPYNVSELEINHGAGLIVALDSGNLVGGSGYTPAVGTLTYANVPLTGGTGAEATADITVTNGTVVLATIRNQGTRYSIGDTLSANNADIGGTGAGFVIPVDSTEGNGIARYEVASVTDVSSTIPSDIVGTPSITSAGVEGPWYVTYTFADVGYTPKNEVPYTVAGATNTLFNGAYTATAVTSTSATLQYDEDPGSWVASSSPTIWGLGNIIRLNLNTGGNNDTATTGLATDLYHDQMLVIRGNQNFKYYEVDDTNPTRPSTALTFINDPNGAGEDAIVYRVLAYSTKGPLNEDLAVDEAILGADTTYDYIKMVVDEDHATTADPLNPGKTYGSQQGDVALAIDRLNEVSVEARLNSADMIIAWDGKIHRVVSYTDLGIAAGYAVLRIADVAGKDLNTSPVTGIQSPVVPGYNLDIAEPPTLRAGLAETEAAQIVVRISTCRVTGHDFLDIGTGSYNQSNFPGKIYGAPKTPNQAKEVEERSRGRCFYVTTDQDGIFRVGRFFEVDQGTGRVTFAASIALSNLDGLGFKRGVTVSEFSNDDKFTDGANDALPTESAVQSYIDRRLGMDRTSIRLPDTELIGPGYLDRNGILEFTGPDPLNMGGFKISNLETPVSDTDAANKLYVRNQQLSDDRVDTTTSPAKTTNDLLVFNGSKWVNAETILTGDIQAVLDGKSLALNLKSETIYDADVNTYADIAQQKLLMNLATTRAAAPSGTSRVKQATTGLASFHSSQFTATDGFIELQTSSSATTGVTLDKIQKIGASTILGNLGGVSASPSELTPGNVVTAGDGIKNASFAPSSVDANGRAMLLTGITPNTYSTVAITVNGGTSSLVKTDSSGFVDVKGVKVDGYTIIDTSSTTVNLTTPGTGTFMSSVGASSSAVITTMNGTVNVNAISSGSTTNFSPANANVTISPTGSGTVTIAPASVGSINNMNIGATTAGTGKFTSVTSTGRVFGNAFQFDTYNTWNAGAAGGAAIVNSSEASYQALMIVGNNSAGGNRRVRIWDDLYVMGSVMQCNGYQVWHSGNDGSGSGLDADVLDGLEMHTGRNNEANKVVRTDGSGYLQTGYINSSSGDENNASNPGRIWGTNGSDSYLRTYRNANVQVGYSSYAAEAWNNTFYVRGTSPTIQFVDSDNAESRYVHTNSGYIGFLGNTGGWVLRCDNTYTYAIATSALYADLAENYAGDADYEPGTVLAFGGEQEVTISTVHNDTRVAGVVSTKPAHLMNGEMEAEHKIAVALRGRVPCKVIGKTKKGDLLVASAKPGYAVVNNSPAPGTIIGKALENKDSLGEGVIEVVVG